MLGRILAGLVVLGGGVSAYGALPAYALSGTVPVGAAQAFDVMPDGRIVLSSGRTILVESAPGSGGFSPAGQIASGTVSSFGASFIRVSPSGAKIAIGDNNAPGPQNVYVVQTATLTPGVDAPAVPVAVPNFDAAWAGEDRLYVSGSVNFSQPAQVARVDLGPSPSVTAVLTGVGDGSGGVCVHGGRLFAGVGYDATDATTGVIRSFDLPALNAAGSGSPFGGGLFVGDLLSAASLDFDEAGFLLVGGGDFGSATFDAGAAAVVNLGTGERLDLAPAGFGFYSVRYNLARHELLVADLFGATPAIYRYAVPAPGAGCVIMLVFAGSLRRARRG